MQWTKWFKKGDTVELGFVCPEYDELTRGLSRLASRHAQKNGIRKYIGEDANRESVKEFLDASQATPTSVIFSGHGSSDALLTAPHLGIQPDRYGNRKHSRLLGRRSFRTFRQLMFFAYACKAGQDLTVVAAASGSNFIGYSDDIPFTKDEHGNIHKAFAPPIEIAIEDAQRRSRLDKRTADRIRNYYGRTTDKLRKGKKKKDPQARLLRIALMWHQDTLSVKEGF